jgi:hypothetical protein
MWFSGQRTMLWSALEVLARPLETQKARQGTIHCLGALSRSAVGVVALLTRHQARLEAAEAVDRWLAPLVAAQQADTGMLVVAAAIRLPTRQQVAAVAALGQSAARLQPRRRGLVAAELLHLSRARLLFAAVVAAVVPD